MRGLIDTDQLMSPGLLKSATALLSVLLSAVAAIVLLKALGSLFQWRPVTALLQVAAGLSVPLSIWLVIRLLSENLNAQLRLTDRLTILTEAMREDRQPVSPASHAASATATPKAAGFQDPAASAPEETSQKDSSVQDDDDATT